MNRSAADAVSEASALLSHPHSRRGRRQVGELGSTNRTFSADSRKKMLAVVGMLVTTLFCWSALTNQQRSDPIRQQQHTRVEMCTVALEQSQEEGGEDSPLFPPDFVWGVATSAYQIEGAVDEDGRGKTIWDTFVRVPGAILDNSTGDVADDHYHRWREDVALMKTLNVRAYRFSIAWSRILPEGRGEVNLAGVRFYQRLVDELLENNIEPWITLFHWDLPQALQDDFGGWLDRQCIDAFVEYARVVFQHFTPRVKHFITLNEPWTFSVNGHGSGIHAPGRKNHPDTEPYIVGHNMLLAHARVFKMYKEEFAGDDGMIGIANCGDFRYPRLISSERDSEAAERAMLFQWGWFVEPLVFGFYPTVMAERLGNRLPCFTASEEDELRGSFDFLGLNYYSSLLASTPDHEASYGGYWADIFVDFSDDPAWTQNDMGWNVVPDGLREMILWVSKRYNDPLVFITENGSAVHEPSEVETVLQDMQRIEFIKGHLQAVAQARKSGMKTVAGYFAWSLLDNFEWQFGFQKDFGVCRVDYDTLERSPKASALWYRETIRANGRNIVLGVAGSRRSLSVGPRRETPKRVPLLPRKVLVGYASNCDKVRTAVHSGVNIVMWSFLDVVIVNNATRIITSLNLTAIRDLIGELNRDGYENVLHFASVGGWNGRHIEPAITAVEWYQTFKEQVGDIFDGIDFDFEGNDELSSPYNYFTLDCLDKIGEISRLAKQDGLFVGMAPPQSYLDIYSSNWSRFVNLTDPERFWHSDFHYFGNNVYAYILKKYGCYFDLVSIQFYESYSKAALAVYHDGESPSDYLVHLVDALVLKQEMMYVDFFTDPDRSVRLLSRNVSLPLEKLVFGLGNGWTSVDSGDDKALYIPPEELELAWNRLSRQHSLPRGFMFWTIDEEGRRGIFLAKELRRILDTSTAGL